MTTRRAIETSSNAVENDTIKSIVLKNPYIVLYPLQKSFRLKSGQKLAQFGKFDLEI